VSKSRGITHVVDADQVTCAESDLIRTASGGSEEAQNHQAIVSHPSLAWQSIERIPATTHCHCLPPRVAHLRRRQAAPVEPVPAACQADRQVPAGSLVAVQDPEVVAPAAPAVPAPASAETLSGLGLDEGQSERHRCRAAHLDDYRSQGGAPCMHRAVAIQLLACLAWGLTQRCQVRWVGAGSRSSRRGMEGCAQDSGTTQQAALANSAADMRTSNHSNRSCSPQGHC